MEQACPYFCWFYQSQHFILKANASEQLLRHVYTSTKTAYKLSRFQAAFVTFLLSACLHELVMAVVTKVCLPVCSLLLYSSTGRVQKLRLYLFGMQMAQLPLIMVGRAKIFKQNPGLGNVRLYELLLVSILIPALEMHSCSFGLVC